MSGRFHVAETPLLGVHVLQRKPYEDERGSFERMYCAEDLADLLRDRRVVQVNRTLTRQRASVRGMHYQLAPSAETKIVSCLRGSVFDVAVDLRRDSPTFLRWHGEVLDAAGHRSLLIPEGCAHGFQALVDGCELLYFHTAPYDPVAERGVNALDPRVAIAWPLAVEHLSERDRSHPLVAPEFDGISV